MASRLATELLTPVELDVLEIDQLTWSLATNQIPQPSVCGVVEVDEEPSVGGGVVEQVFGVRVAVDESPTEWPLECFQVAAGVVDMSEEPVPVSGRANREAVEAATRATWQALHGLVTDAPELPVPGRFGRWLTELFNEWPEGSREATLAATAGGRIPLAPVPDPTGLDG